MILLKLICIQFQHLFRINSFQHFHMVRRLTFIGAFPMEWLWMSQQRKEQFIIGLQVFIQIL